MKPQAPLQVYAAAMRATVHLQMAAISHAADITFTLCLCPTYFLYFCRLLVHAPAHTLHRQARHGQSTGQAR
jgi:hypothetical protein